MKTVSKLVVITAVAVLMAGVQFAYAQHQGHGKAKEVTLKGEVLDMFCYMKHPDSGQGPDHAKCAKSCMDKGLPIGFLAEDGTVYLVIGKDHEPATKLVADFAGKQSVLTGTVYEHHGVKSIEVASIKAAKSD
jgi:hypothetical protein